MANQQGTWLCCSMRKGSGYTGGACIWLELRQVVGEFRTPEVRNKNRGCEGIKERHSLIWEEEKADIRTHSPHCHLQSRGLSAKAICQVNNLWIIDRPCGLVVKTAIHCSSVTDILPTVMCLFQKWIAGPGSTPDEINHSLESIVNWF